GSELYQLAFRRGCRTAIVRDGGRSIPPLHGNMHRSIWDVAMYVREQLPRRQDLVQLSRILECLQADGKRRQQHRKGRSIWGRGRAVFPSQRNWLTAVKLGRSLG